MTDLTFDGYVAALVIIQLKRKMSNTTLAEIKELLDINGDIDMGAVTHWLEEHELASINYSEYGDGFNFYLDGDSLLQKGYELVEQRF